MLLPKTKKVMDAKHLAFIRTLPCLKYGRGLTVEAAHIRTGTDGGMGLKPSDCFVIPLSTLAHRREQHQWGELSFYHGEEGLEIARQLAKDLYENTGNEQECVKLINRAREEIFL